MFSLWRPLEAQKGRAENANPARKLRFVLAAPISPAFTKMTQPAFLCF